ncbi:MAG: 4Fe-4S dicluster domain-containing protein [Dehalococcoidia bacterium]|nr:MAG: 4Fe-4S dicluster domain-containing protein [Dehalococcoidia bacterium]
MVRIEINEQKCKSPRECRKCLESCPESVMMTYPRVAREPGKKAEDWAIAPVLMTLCTGCKVCEEICPQKAITVSLVA